MKFKELKAMPREELEKKITDIQLELMKDRAQIAIGAAPKSAAKIRQSKKTIARINTILAEAEKKA